MWKKTVFFEIVVVIEDILLETCYLYFFRSYLNDFPANTDAATKKRILSTFRLLVTASIIVTVGDILGLKLLYMEMILARLSFLGFLYSVKLTLEFFVLNQLTDISELKSQLLQRGNLSGGISASIDPASENLRSMNRPIEVLDIDMAIRKERIYMLERPPSSAVTFFSVPVLSRTMPTTKLFGSDEICLTNSNYTGSANNCEGAF
jgi:hypothetical protein